MAGNIRIMHAGGLVGQARALLWGRSFIEQSYASGNVTVDSTYNRRRPLDAIGAADLSAHVDQYATIRNVYALGDVSVTGASQREAPLAAGGLIGRLDGTVEYAYSTGAVSGPGKKPLPQHVSRRLDRHAPAIRQQHYRRVLGHRHEWHPTTGVGRRSRRRRQPHRPHDRAGAHAVELRSAFNFSNAQGTWFMVDGQTRPFLRMEYSTTIRNAHQLQLMAMDLGANYVLANNIDFTGQFDESGMWGARGFSPVGYISHAGGQTTQPSSAP